jgi:hypothetical protein
MKRREFFKVKEEDEEEENDSELSDNVNDLSQDRIKEAEEVEATMIPK